MFVDLSKSKLLDIRDCESRAFKEISEKMTKIKGEMQPGWLSPLLGLSGQTTRQDLLFRIGGTREWEYPWAILSADLKPGMRLLDAGCGSSPLLIYLARRGFQCWGIDPDIPQHRGVGRTLLRLAGVNLGFGYYDLSKKFRLPIAYERQGIQQMKFEDGFFDRVFCISVIEHIPRSEWQICVQQLLRVLSPGGKLLLTMDMGREDTHRYEDIIRYSGAQFQGSIDHSIPRSIRHPHWKRETAGIVIVKES